MNYLIDTNIFSEPTKPSPAPMVLGWLKRNESRIYTSAITIGELRRGVERLADGKHKKILHIWLQQICETMKGRILSFNVSTGHVWGQLLSRLDEKGLTMPSVDSQIAAIALRHNLALATRNTEDFKNTGLTIINPFDDQLEV